MSGNSFDYIAQELLKQKKVMDTLRAENRELHRQLTELRAGQGIFIEIAGQRFSLAVDAAVSQHPVTTSTTAQLDLSSPPLTPALQPEEIAEIELSDTHENEIVDAPVAETPMAEASPAPQAQQEPTEITFLEEIMLDEFAAASTNHIATWTGPTKKQEQIDEEQKAALRRELMGSFLLE